MEFGDKIVVNNKAVKTRLNCYPADYIPESWVDDMLDWREFPEMSEMITHYAMIGYWPLFKVDMITCYRKASIAPVDVLLIGKRYVNIGITGEIIIVYDDEYPVNYSCIAGEKKFIPFYNLELLLCVANGRTNPFLSFIPDIKPKLIFNHETYISHMEHNVVSDILCDQHENHRKIWDNHYKTWECDLCESRFTESTIDNDEIPF